MCQKIINAIALCGIVAIVYVSKAEAAEQFPLTIEAGISKCTVANGNVACDSGNPTAQTVSISLDSCIEIPGSVSQCWGIWQATQNRDGYDFTSSVTVSKIVTSPMEKSSSHPKQIANVQYSISATTAPAWSSSFSFPFAMTLGQVGALTDAVSFSGEKMIIVNSNPQISYHPTLSLAPPPTPNTIPKH